MPPKTRAAEVQLRFKLVRQELEGVLRGVATIESSSERLVSSIEQSGKRSDVAAQQIDTVGDAALQSAKKIDSETDAIEQNTLALRENADAGQVAGQVQSRAKGSIERFGAIAAGPSGDGESAASSLALGGFEELLEILGSTEGVAGQVATRIGGVASAATQTSGAVAAAGISMGVLAAVALPVAVALVGLALAVKKFAKIVREGREDVNRALNAQEEYYKVIQEGTSETIREEIAALEVRRRAQQQFVDDLETKLPIAFRAFDVAQREGVVGGGQIKKRLEEAQKALKDMAFESDALERALDNAEVAANDLTEAEDRLTEQRIATIERRSQIRQRADQMEASGTSEGVQERLAALDLERQGIRRLLKELESLDQENEDVQQKTAELTTSLTDLALEEAILTEETLGLVRARELEQKRIEDLEQTLEDAADATEQFNKDVARIEERAQQERLRLQERFANAQVQIARRAAEQAAKALEKLQQERTELNLQLSRDRQDAQLELQRDEMETRIDFQREEARTAQEHADNLIDIQRSAQQEEFELALKRDFAGISQLRRRTSQQLQKENEGFADQREERLVAFQQEREDQQRHFIQERQDRLRKFRQQLRDADVALRRELQLIARRKTQELILLRQALDAELRMVQQKLQNEKALLREGIRQELNIIAQGMGNRLALERNFWEASLKQASQIAGANFAQLIAQPSSTTNVGGINVNQTFQSGADLQAVRRLVQTETLRTMEQVFLREGR